MSVVNPIIIPDQPGLSQGDVFEYEGQHFTVDQHFSQGKDMKGLNYSHIMFSSKGAFGLMQVGN